MHHFLGTRSLFHYPWLVDELASWLGHRRIGGQLRLRGLGGQVSRHLRFLQQMHQLLPAVILRYLLGTPFGIMVVIRFRGHCLIKMPVSE